MGSIGGLASSSMIQPAMTSYVMCNQARRITRLSILLWYIETVTHTLLPLKAYSLLKNTFTWPLPYTAIIRFLSWPNTVVTVPNLLLAMTSIIFPITCYHSMIQMTFIIVAIIQYLLTILRWLLFTNTDVQYGLLLRDYWLTLHLTIIWPHIIMMTILGIDITFGWLFDIWGLLRRMMTGDDSDIDSSEGWYGDWLPITLLTILMAIRYQYSSNVILTVLFKWTSPNVLDGDGIRILVVLISYCRQWQWRTEAYSNELMAGHGRELMTMSMM